MTDLQSTRITTPPCTSAITSDNTRSVAYRRGRPQRTSLGSASTSPRGRRAWTAGEFRALRGRLRRRPIDVDPHERRTAKVVVRVRPIDAGDTQLGPRSTRNGFERERQLHRFVCLLVRHDDGDLRIVVMSRELIEHAAYCRGFEGPTCEAQAQGEFMRTRFRRRSAVQRSERRSTEHLRGVRDIKRRRCAVRADEPDTGRAFHGRQTT